MSKELIERLRDGQEIHDGDWSMLDEAAELIDKLLSTVDSYKQQLSDMAVKLSVATQYIAPYEELRAVIDGGSESMNHDDAVREVKDMQARIAQLEEALKVARDALKELSPEETLGQHFSNNCSCNAINKINEVIGS